MTVKTLSQAYQTSDGEIFTVRAEADAHEQRYRLGEAIRTAKARLRNETYELCDEDRTIAKLLVAAGVRVDAPDDATGGA